MACFLAPAAEAIIVSAIKRNQKKKEENASLTERAPASIRTSSQGIPWSRKLSWLSAMLWGGVFLLAIEHIWHGEVVPWPPFLTAMYHPGDIQPMLMEILTVGGSMVLFVTVVWYLATIVADRIYKKPSESTSAAPVK